jgi:DNA repair photolyase
MDRVKTALALLPFPESPRELLRPHAGCQPNAMAMDVAEGCGAACVHCVGGHAGERYGDATRVEVYPRAAQRLGEELDHLAAQGRRPSVVRLGLQSDPLMAPAVAETLAALQALFDRGIRVELHTRSMVPEPVVALLRRHPQSVVVVAGVMAARDSAARVYEPGLAPTQGRLRSLRPLVAAGVRVHVRVEPLIPLVNDTEADLDAIFAACVSNGLHRVELVYLQLTEGTAKALSRGLPRMHREMLKGLFGTESWTETAHGKRKFLPAMLREPGYDRAVTVARRHGVTATVCSCAEPSLRHTRSCQRWAAEVAVEKKAPAVAAQQLALFQVIRGGKA